MIPDTTLNDQATALENDPGLADGTNENTDSNITSEESELLDSAGDGEPGDDDDMAEEASLDNEDDDGDELNESDDLTGDDLDVPGSESDNDDELVGDEDEENNSYSLSDQEDEPEEDPIF